MSIIKAFERVISATEIIYYDGIPVLGLSSGSQYLYFPDKLLVTAFSAINSVKGDMGNHY